MLIHTILFVDLFNGYLLKKDSTVSTSDCSVQSPRLNANIISPAHPQPEKSLPRSLSLSSPCCHCTLAPLVPRIIWRDCVSRSPRWGARCRAYKNWCWHKLIFGQLMISFNITEHAYLWNVRTLIWVRCHNQAKLWSDWLAIYVTPGFLLCFTIIQYLWGIYYIRYTIIIN